MKRMTALVFVTAFVIGACNSGDKKTDAAKDKYEPKKHWKKPKRKTLPVF
jgi:hypothetical protein